jgi:hypothetical protein
MAYENLVGKDEDRFRVEEDPKNPGEYHFSIGKRGKDGRAPVHYYLQSGVLDDVANADWGTGELERKLDLISPEMTFMLVTMIGKRECDWYDVSLALGMAAEEVEKRYRDYLNAQKAGK